MREVSDLPVAVGFGISNAQQVADVWRYADAVVVGSAIVAEIERLGAAPDVAGTVGEFARKLLPQSRSRNSSRIVAKKSLSPDLFREKK
jgi:tryptophan synthase alpha chain